jgi:hypothetical protein
MLSTTRKRKKGGREKSQVEVRREEHIRITMRKLSLQEEGKTSLSKFLSALPSFIQYEVRVHCYIQILDT